MDNLKPMDAVAALYSDDDHELSAAIIGSLSRAIFEGSHVKPAGTLKKALARAVPSRHAMDHPVRHRHR